MFRTSSLTERAGPFGGALVVSMRPVPSDRVEEAYEITRPYGRVHGAPVHHGDHEVLGIRDLSCPDWGDAVTLREGEVPVFWACGVTSHVAVMEALRTGRFYASSGVTDGRGGYGYILYVRSEHYEDAATALGV